MLREILITILFIICGSVINADTYHDVLRPMSLPSIVYGPKNLDLYTLSVDDFAYINMCQKEAFLSKEKKNPLYEAPKNLVAGDSQMTVATKIENSRMQILQDVVVKQLQQSDIAYSLNSSAKGVMNSAQGMTNSVKDITTRVQGFTDHSVNTQTKLCNFKNSVQYNVNNNSTIAQSVCESYNARITYSLLSNAYEFNVFRQFEAETKIGIKTTNFANSGLVFVEGKW